VTDTESHYFIPSKRQRQLTEKDIKTFHQRRLKFDTFKHWRNRVSVVNLT